MGWEFRLFVPLLADGPAGIPPLEFFTKEFCNRARGERRADVYLDFQDPGLGAKYRDCSEGGVGGRPEVKTQTEIKKRGAAQWTKTKGKGDGWSKLLTPETASRAAIVPRVLLRKHRWTTWMEGVDAEQTDLEVFVGAAPAPGAAVTWSAVGRYRTICFENDPKAAYKAAARWLNLREEWEPQDLEAILAKYNPPEMPSGGDGSNAMTSSRGPAVLPAMVGGYPEFVAAITRLVGVGEEAPAASAADGSDVVAEGLEVGSPRTPREPQAQPSSCSPPRTPQKPGGGQPST